MPRYTLYILRYTKIYAVYLADSSCRQRVILLSAVRNLSWTPKLPSIASYTAYMSPYSKIYAVYLADSAGRQQVMLPATVHNLRLTPKLPDISRYTAYILPYFKIYVVYLAVYQDIRRISCDIPRYTLYILQIIQVASELFCYLLYEIWAEPPSYQV